MLRDANHLSDSAWAWAVFVFSFVLLKVLFQQHIFKNLPPGPTGLPYLGFLPYLKQPAHIHYNQLAKKYGPVFSTAMGDHLLVMISDPKLIRRAFFKANLCCRPKGVISEIVGNYGIVNVDGKLWKTQRKFLLRQIHKIPDMEARIKTELNIFLCGLSLMEGKPVNISALLALPISNVICSTIMSVRFKETDERFQRFTKQNKEGFKLLPQSLATNFIKLFRYLPEFRNSLVKLQSNNAEFRSFFKEVVNHHKASFNPLRIRDFVDAHLAKDATNNERQLQQVLGDLYSSGVETTKATLTWAFFFMLKKPEVLSKVQEELDNIIGTNRMPSLDDVKHLPYTEATLLEVLRMSNIVPLGTTHCTTTPVSLEGYHIPKNTQVIPLLYSVHMNPQLWPNPEQFDPSRFLSVEGSVLRSENLIPFGVGRRRCLGESLAKKQIFIFFASLMHLFNITPDQSESPAFHNDGDSVLSSVPEYNVVISVRKPGLLSYCKDSIKNL